MDNESTGVGNIRYGKIKFPEKIKSLAYVFLTRRYDSHDNSYKVIREI